MSFLKRLFKRSATEVVVVEEQPVERREYYRQKVDASCILARLDETGATEFHLEGTLLDVSVAGVKFYADEMWNVGDKITLTWSCPSYAQKDFKFTCEIVRVEPDFVYGCTILDLSESERKELSNAIFQLQQAERYKNLQ